MDEGMNLNIGDFVRIIKDKLGVITTITLITVLAVTFISFFALKPTYQASASIIVGKPEEATKTNSSDVLMYQNLVKTYIEIAKSNLVAQGAVDKLNNKVTIDKIKSNTSVSAQTGTQIIIVSAKGKTPVEAYEIVNSMATSFVESAKKVYPTGGDIQIIDKAEMPVSPISPNKKLNMAVAFLLGLMASLGLVFLLEYMDSTIKTESDIERYLELPVIGIIPKVTE